MKVRGSVRIFMCAFAHVCDSVVRAWICPQMRAYVREYISVHVYKCMCV